MTDPARLTIRAFADASRLSVKALRLYDDLGLLPPAQVDRHNGYRYYSPAQLPQAQLIGLLRQLDLSLKDIQDVLDAPPPRRPERLREHWARAKAEHARRDALARYVQHKLQGDAPMPEFELQTRQVPAQHLATLTWHVLVQDLPRTIQDSFRQLHVLIREQGATFAGPPLVIYHGEVNADSDGPIEVCWPYSGILTPSGDVALRVEPAHTEAFVALTREQFEFPAILSAYDATCAYASAHGTGSPLPCREVYPYDWDNAAPGEPVGEVAWPYTPKGA
ncbi:MerR family transcriptional regulator [Deinococcus fonticola]|uniref:MerR family transcriptional regulator n=1 Tax=Deinococcus fonticola TaxID=2528713 RepID=UPI0010754D29|nr:MerR family transcriptional regulator [Deinococcus fonticola]